MEYKSKIFQEDVFKGNYSGSGSLIVNGVFDGLLTIDDLVITPSGSFLGKVIAQNIVIEGTLNADVETELIHIKSTGSVEGDLVYRQIKIDSGGLLKSSKVMKMSDKKAIKRFNASS